MFREYFTDAAWQQTMPGVYSCLFQTESSDGCTSLPVCMAPRTAEVFFCIGGSISLHRSTGQTDRLEKESILLLSSCDDLSRAEVTLPLEGICLYIDEKAAEASLSELCRAYGDLPLTMKQIGQVMAIQNGICLFSSQVWCQSAFHFLQQLSPENRPKYCIMKCFELLYLLDLEQAETGSHPEIRQSVRWAQTAKAMQDFLLTHLGEKLTIEDLSRQFHLSSTACKSCFHTCCGQPIHKWLAGKRRERAAQLLSHSALSVLQIAQAVGYSSCSQFNAAFKKKYCQTPRQYRNRVRSR